MATELDVSKSRRFDIAMSRRTRRSTSLVTCFQDQYVPPPTQHRHKDAKLKTLLQCQDAELQRFHQFEEVEQQNPCPYEEDEELRIPQALLQYEDGEEKTLEQYEDEQEKEPWKYQDREQKKQEQHQDGEKKPEQYLDEEKTLKRFEYEEAKTSKCHDEKQVSPKEYYGEEETREQYQDEEHKAPEHCQEADAPASQQNEEESEEHKTSEQRQGVKNLPAPSCAVDGVPRFSLQELIQEKQLPVREAKFTSKLGGHGENVLADHKVSRSVVGATGGTTLAMVIRRPEGGIIRRCVKAFNQMIKAKHGSKKSTTL